MPKYQYSLDTSNVLFFVFALCERKNEKQYNVKVPLCQRLKHALCRLADYSLLDKTEQVI